MFVNIANHSNREKEIQKRSQFNYRLWFFFPYVAIEPGLDFGTLKLGHVKKERVFDGELLGASRDESGLSVRVSNSA